MAQGQSEEEAKKNAPVMLEAQEMLRKWEARDPEVYSLWETMNGWVYEGFDVTYKALGVDFDKVYYESQTYLLGKALVEALFMGLIVIIVSELWGNRLGARFAAKVSDPQRDNPYFCRLMRQAGTVSVMCPTMSLAATIIFSMILGGAPVWQLPAIWAGTLIKNFPMAFFWNMFAAAPFTNWVCGKLFE